MISLPRYLTDLKLGFKLNLLLLLILGPLLLVIVVVLNNALANLARQTGQQRVQEEIEVIRGHFAQIEANLLTATKLVAATPGGIEALAAGDAAKAKINFLIGAAPFAFDEIDLIDAQGNFIESDPKIRKPDHQGEEELLTLALLGIETTGLTIDAEPEPKLRLSVALPLKDSSGTLVGGLLASRALDDDFLAQLNFFREKAHLILIYDHRPMAYHILHRHHREHQDDAPHLTMPNKIQLAMIFPDLVNQPALERALQGQTTIAEKFARLTGIDETEHGLAYLPLTIGGDTKTAIIILFNLSELNSFQTRLTRNLSLVFTFLIAAAIGTIALFAQRSITRPLAKLDGIAKQMMKGDLTARADIKSQDEIGSLAVSFNNMAGQLQQSLTGLEQRVAERTRELAQARDQALAASRLKTELLAKVSHEFRTPLNAILGFAEMLQVGVYGPISEEQQQPAQEIIDSVHYLTGLVDELLDQAQLEAGKLKLNISNFSPVDVVDPICARMRVLAQAQGTSLSVDIAGDMPSKLSGDPARLQQILANLVNNAIKFTEAGSVQIRLDCNQSQWTMQVADTGPGIPPEAQTRIFEPFGQVDSSMTREHRGAGLGLSIVKQLTELMGGNIILESEVGQGSTFTVLLPLENTRETVT